MGYIDSILVRLGLRRPNKWERPTLIDSLLSSPVTYLTTIVFNFVVFLCGTPFKPPRNRPPIKVVCISDTHDQFVDIPDGDLLIHAGDLTNGGTVHDIQKQLDWLDSLPHRAKVVVCGNHDSWFDPTSRNPEDRDASRKPDLKSIHYLEHSSVVLGFDGGRELRIYGAPDIPICGGRDNASDRPSHGVFCYDIVSY
jgi:Calcineurin-like phosphoesterase